MTDLIVRSGLLSDLPLLTEIHNHYVTSTHITFDVQPFTPEQRTGWFKDHTDGHRYRLLVAESDGEGVLGYAGTGRFRTKAAYDTTVELTIACNPKATGRGIGTKLYQELLLLIANEDINRLVAGIAQPNP